MESRGNIIVILGPTSSGKSDVAIKLARKFNGEIISADSRQIYRGMDMSTGKIHGAYNMEHKTFISEGIIHYMIDIVSPKTDYNVAKFKKQVDKIIPNILKRGKLPIICGGTGFWIKAIVDNVKFPEVKPNWKLRKKLDKKKITELIQELKRLDPERLKTIDQKNKVRLIRAIEICKAIGFVPDTKYKMLNTKYKFLQIGIKLSKEKLYANIRKRLEARFNQEMIKEVANLKKSGLNWKKIQSFGLAYYWIPLYLQGELPRDELFKKIYQAEKDYAKRQMTWFRKDKGIKWLKSRREMEKEIKEFIL